MKPLFPDSEVLIPEYDRFHMNYEGCDIYQVVAANGILESWMVVWGSGFNNYATVTADGTIRQPARSEAHARSAVVFAQSLAKLHQ